MNARAIAVGAGAAIVFGAVVWAGLFQRERPPTAGPSARGVEAQALCEVPLSGARSGEEAARKLEQVAHERGVVEPSASRRSPAANENLLVWTVEGRVVDADGSPVPGAGVDLFDLAWKDGGMTDANGCFGPKIFLVPSIDGELAVVPPKVAFEIRRGGDLWFVSSAPVVDAAQSSLEVEVRLAGHAQLEGLVRRGDGTPAVGARIVATRLFPALDPIEMSTGTDDDGRYALSLCGPGAYRIELGNQDMDGVFVARASRELRMEAGTTLVDFLDPGPPPAPPVVVSAEEEAEFGSVRGRVVFDPQPAPTSAARVHLLSGRVVVEEDRIEPDGEFSFEAVEGGEYTAIAICPGYARGRFGPFTVVGGRCTGLDSQLLRSRPPLQGRVVDPHGAPVVGAVLTLSTVFSKIYSDPNSDVDFTIPDETDAVATTATDSDGGFTLCDIGGPRTLSVRSNGLVDWFRAFDGDDPTGGSPLVIALDAPRRVRGRVESPDGFPFAALHAWGTGSRFNDVAIASDGTFEFPDASTSEFDVEICVGDFGAYPHTGSRVRRAYWTPNGLVVARRTVPAGREDVDLGRWMLSGGE